MRTVWNSGLVLEGGGMRGVFTSGVLDAFMKHELYFNYVVAVSAGACNGLSYMSRQPRRARVSNIDMLVKYDYISLRNLVTRGSIFDPELLYERFPNEIVPYDYDAFFGSGATFEMVATNCLTGRAEYLSESSGDRKRLIDIVKASSSLPYVSRMTLVDGVPMLDGGIVDSIPVLRAIETGHRHNVVIATRNRGWRNKGRDRRLPPFVYKNYPRLRVALSHRILPPSVTPVDEGFLLRRSQGDYYWVQEARPWIAARTRPRRLAVSTLSRWGRAGAATLEEIGD